MPRFAMASAFVGSASTAARNSSSAKSNRPALPKRCPRRTRVRDAKVAASRTRVRRGQRLGKAGRFDLAELEFRAAVEADPTNADAIANLGISLANLGRVDEAQRRLSESLAR